MHKKQGFALPSRTPAGKTLPDIQENKVMAATGAEKPQNPAENSALAARLAREMTGDVFFDAFNRGRYATDASFYQILPLGVVVPRTMDEALRALSIARDEGLDRHPARRRDLAMRPDRQRRESSSTFPST